LNNDTICGLLSCKFNQNQCCYEYRSVHDTTLCDTDLITEEN
jgi:hypothetical protein